MSDDELFSGRYYRVETDSSVIKARTYTMYVVEGVDDYRQEFFHREDANAHAEKKEREAHSDLFTQPIYDNDG